MVWWFIPVVVGEGGGDGCWDSGAVLVVVIGSDFSSYGCWRVAS